MKTTECPRCGGIINLAGHYEGDSIKCPKCQEPFEVIRDMTGLDVVPYDDGDFQ